MALDFWGKLLAAYQARCDWFQPKGISLPGDTIHADTSFHFGPTLFDMVTVWLAITDATVENGCLQVAPGKTLMLPHCPKTQTAITDGYVDLTKAVPLPVKVGGAVIFHPLTPHASLVNRTEGFRWSFVLLFNVTGQPTGRTHFPEFIARSRARPETVLTGWRDRAKLWDDARSRLAIAPHTPIHRWQSDSPACA